MTLPLFGPQMAAECATLCGRDTKERWVRAEDGLQLHWNAHRSKGRAANDRQTMFQQGGQGEDATACAGCCSWRRSAAAFAGCSRVAFHAAFEVEAQGEGAGQDCRRAVGVGSQGGWPHTPF